MINLKTPLLLMAFVGLTAFVACSENDRAKLGPTDERSQQETDDDGDNPPVADPEPTVPEKIELIAEKTYGPSQWNDGVFDENVDIGEDISFEIEIPSEINVTAGNAGNHSLELRIDENGVNVLCDYKGGADVSKPIRSGNPVQIEKGMKYLFQSCTNGTAAGDTIAVESTIRVRVNNGDSTERTEVTVEFETNP